MKLITPPQRLVGEVQMLRIRVASAESKVKMMREQAREAKRRRKEAKRNAQLVRRRFKHSKADLSELRKALAEAETKLFQVGGRALARKTRQVKRTAQTRVRKLVTAKAARCSPAPSRKTARTKEKCKADAGRADNTVLKAAAETPALSSLESITTGGPVPNTTPEPS